MLTIEQIRSAIHAIDPTFDYWIFRSLWENILPEESMQYLMSVFSDVHVKRYAYYTLDKNIDLSVDKLHGSRAAHISIDIPRRMKYQATLREQATIISAWRHHAFKIVESHPDLIHESIDVKEHIDQMNKYIHDDIASTPVGEPIKINIVGVRIYDMLNNVFAYYGIKTAIQRFQGDGRIKRVACELPSEHVVWQSLFARTFIARRAIEERVKQIKVTLRDRPYVQNEPSFQSNGYLERKLLNGYIENHQMSGDIESIVDNVIDTHKGAQEKAQLSKGVNLWGNVIDKAALHAANNKEWKRALNQFEELEAGYQAIPRGQDSPILMHDSASDFPRDNVDALAYAHAFQKSIHDHPAARQVVFNLFDFSAGGSDGSDESGEG